MSVTQNGHTPKAPSQGWTSHTVWHNRPNTRAVDDALARAQELENRLPGRVLPFAEDWDLVILAREVKRLRQLIDIP